MRRPRHPPTLPGHKVCTHCLQEKRLELFPTHAKTLDGRGSWCRACHQVLINNWHARHRVQRQRAR